MVKKLFGTDGIRGIVGESPITPDFCLNLGYTLGNIIVKKKLSPNVIIGKDTRVSGYLFESCLSAGLIYAGVNSHIVGPIPTPAIAYLTNKYKMSCGVVISASHNPYTDNGFKFFCADGHKISDDFEKQIEDEINNEMIISPQLGKLFRVSDSYNQYINFCINSISKDISLKGLKLVIDCANGATYHLAPEIFRQLGADVIPIGCKPDGFNINLNCGSNHPQFLIKKVIEENADLGIAFDGDGDRVIFVDSKQKIYNGDKLIYAILKDKLNEKTKIDGIVGTVMTNIAMENALKKLNVNFFRAPVGDRFVFEELTNRNWTLGGESSGHILCLDKHSTGDGIIASLQVLSAIVNLNKSLSDIVDWDDYPQTIINVKLNKLNHNVIDNAKDLINIAKQNLEGNGRVIVRLSGTEPVVRVTVESIEPEISRLWANRIADRIRGIS